MRHWFATWWRRGNPLVRQFALLSFLVTGVTTAALMAVISDYLRNDLLDREWNVTATYIRKEARTHLVPTDFTAPQTTTAQDRFRRFYEQTILMPEIVRVKIYDATMAVVWSDEPRLIGQRFRDNPQLLGAVDGHTMVNLELGEKKGENIYEGDDFPRLVEVYVPIMFPGVPGVAGVVETYKNPDQVLANIRRVRIMLVTTGLAGWVLVYGSLFWIVRRAARRIEHQHEALQERTGALTAANEELQTVQGQLLKAERLAAIGEVVTAVAHGIRNPLANIRAAAQVALLDCRDGGASALVSRNLFSVMAEVDRLEGRIKDLLQFVRPTERRSAPVDLNAVLRGSLRMMAGRIAKTKVTVIEEFAPSLPVIMGDSVLLEQAFMNLIGNAVEAIGDGPGTLAIVTAAEADGDREVRVVVDILDSGIGVPADDFGKIFDLFYTTKPQGTGLGLALAKKFIEAHEGRVSVQSEPGKTAFRITFPVAGGYKP